METKLNPTKPVNHQNPISTMPVCVGTMNVQPVYSVWDLTRTSTEILRYKQKSPTLSDEVVQQLANRECAVFSSTTCLADTHLCSSHQQGRLLLLSVGWCFSLHLDRTQSVLNSNGLIKVFRTNNGTLHNLCRLQVSD